VALKWVLPEHDSDKAKALRHEFRNKIHVLLAPDIFPAEIGHSLVRAERRRMVLPGAGLDLLSDVTTTVPQLHPSLPLLPEAFALASAMRISLYDCLYVALADREQCELVTADERLVNVLQKRFPFVIPLSTLP